MAKLTFGKFSGLDTMELAAGGDTGRDYLRWGAENLKSPKWRQLFQEALDADVAFDMETAARLMVRDQGDISFDEALLHLQEMEEFRLEEERMLEAWQTWKDEYRAALAELGVTHHRVIRALLDGEGVAGLEEIGVQWSSPERRAEVAALARRMDKRFPA